MNKLLMRKKCAHATSALVTSPRRLRGCGWPGIGEPFIPSRDVAETIAALGRFLVVGQDLEEGVRATVGLAHRAILPLFS